MKIQTFDTTLRDGTQGEMISFTVEDKLLIAQKLDELGIDYIEGGWPGSNPKDKEFFARARRLRLRHAKITAFGSTRLARNRVDRDPSVLALVEAGTPAVAIFGKSWNLHTERALRVTEEQNLTLISETVKFVKDHGKEVIYDAEHFFDGFNADPDFALRTLEAALEAGADILCLCDTNGGNMPGRVGEIVDEVRRRFGAVLGIHAHNDADVAVANTIVAVQHGALHVQGCINGYGERCGNANLCSVLPNLELKLGYETIGPEGLANLTSVSRFVAELANLPLRNDQPYVGRSAFAHKGGVHVNAVAKDAATYEHIRPELVGNRQRVLLSDLSGRSNILYKLKEHGLEGRLSPEAHRELLERVKHLEFLGYELETAEGTFELLVREALNPGLKLFEIVHFEVTTKGNRSSHSTATVTLHRHRDLEGQRWRAFGHCHRSRPGECPGSVPPPVPFLAVPGNRQGSSHRLQSPGAGFEKGVGVSENVIEASWFALTDAIRLELMRRLEGNEPVEKTEEDNSWGV